MKLDEELILDSGLRKCSYRELQKQAKALKLPANYKKEQLIKMIHTKKYGSAEELYLILDQIKVQRQSMKSNHCSEKFNSSVVFKSPSSNQTTKVQQSSFNQSKQSLHQESSLRISEQDSSERVLRNRQISLDTTKKRGSSVVITETKRRTIVKVRVSSVNAALNNKLQTLSSHIAQRDKDSKYMKGQLSLVTANGTLKNIDILVSRQKIVTESTKTTYYEETVEDNMDNNTKVISPAQNRAIEYPTAMIAEKMPMSTSPKAKTRTGYICMNNRTGRDDSTINTETVNESESMLSSYVDSMYAPYTNMAASLPTESQYTTSLVSTPLQDTIATAGNSELNCNDMHSERCDSLQHLDPYSDLYEDALDHISQDQGFLEKEGLDVRMQCVVCPWAGPKVFLCHHIRKEHEPLIHMNHITEWNIIFKLSEVRFDMWRSQVMLSNYGSLYVLSVKLLEPDLLKATLTTPITGMNSQMGVLTIYDKATGEAHYWRGEIQQLSSSMPYQNEQNGFLVNLRSYFSATTEELYVYKASVESIVFFVKI